MDLKKPKNTTGQMPSTDIIHSDQDTRQRELEERVTEQNLNVDVHITDQPPEISRRLRKSTEKEYSNI